MRGEHPHVPGVTDSRAGCVDPHEEVRESTHKDEESVSQSLCLGLKNQELGDGALELTQCAL